MESYFGDVDLVRWIFQRSLAGIYLIAFLVAWNQFPALLGEKGLLPVPHFLKRVPFLEVPSLFHWRYSDSFFRVVAGLGILLSCLALFGLSEAGPLWLSMVVWLTLWALYLSIVNVGQNFYAFGWESMLLEAGFFAAFLGPTQLKAPLIPILLLRWMLFRVEFGAGLIKLRHDPCWRDLTWLFYHYETQPLPNPLSWYFHRLPKFSHRFGVLFSHFVQVIAPFGLFAPQPFAALAGACIIFHQLWLIISGNYSWLNWLTVVLGLTAFNDAALAPILPLHFPAGAAGGLFYDILLYLLAGATVLLSIQPTLNLFHRNQLMNFCYNKFHLVNTYGAFGSVTKARYEIIVEGTVDPSLSKETEWRAYEFKAKPGDRKRRPPQVAPYHLRLDWLLWFLPFAVRVRREDILVYGHELWFLRFIQRLLEGDRNTLRLLRHNPFPDKPPVFVRAQFYLYLYTDWSEKQKTGAWWKRSLVGEYLPPVSLSELRESGIE